MTKLLAIETTGMRGSVACAEDGRLLAEHTLNPNQRSAQSLAPAIEEILKELGWRPDALDAIAVAIGPGSFTGLRVGVTTAKILAWSCGAAIYGIDALESLVFPALSELQAGMHKDGVPCEIISTGLDAQRGDAVVRDFFVFPDSPNPVPLSNASRLVPVKEWLTPETCQTELRRMTETSVPNIVGEAVRAAIERFRYCGPFLGSKRIKYTESVAARFLPKQYWEPAASSIALAAMARMTRPADANGAKSPNGSDNPFTLLPVYSRESAAEEKRARLRQGAQDPPPGNLIIIR